jgi:hypothetical protein
LAGEVCATLVVPLDAETLPTGTALDVLARLAEASGEPVDAWLVDPNGTRVAVPWRR